MLPPIASLAELTEWSQTPVVNTRRASAILAAASTLVRSHAGRAWVDDEGEWEEGLTDLQKDQAKTVVLTVADRVHSNPSGVTQEATGPFSRSVAAWAAFGLSLTNTEKAMIGRGSGGIPGLSSIRVVAPAAAAGSRWTWRYWEDDDEEEVPVS